MGLAADSSARRCPPAQAELQINGANWRAACRPPAGCAIVLLDAFQQHPRILLGLPADSNSLQIAGDEREAERAAGVAACL
jgi:hypothetical protein